MNTSCRRASLALVLVLASASGCATSRGAGDERPGTGGTGTAVQTPESERQPDRSTPRYTRADVEFMQGMIAHHEQAVVMSALAPRNGAGPRVSLLAERIDVSQRDEIRYMKNWLRVRGETVPEDHTQHAMAGHHMPGTLHAGMLTVEQLKQLEAARGIEFDRLFLKFMIQHHEGAIVMVRQLFSVPGAGQDIDVFQFASDVESDQTAEIDRMQQMLKAIPPG